MSRVLKDYKCLECRHLFESWDAECPECGSHVVATLYLQAPSIRTSNSATVKYPDEFYHNIGEASQGSETIDAVGNELFRDGDPRKRDRMGGGMLWGDDAASVALGKMNLPPIKKELLPGGPPQNDAGIFADAVQYVQENKDRILAP
jgi:hypothetical protein